MTILKNIIRTHFSLLLPLLMLTISACTEDIVMELPEMKIMPVVEGTFTNEYKQHELVLCYTTPMYSNQTNMISGAEIYLKCGDDTIWYHEQSKRPGHYFTDSVAGIKSRWYHLEIRVEDNTLINEPLRIYADSYMPNNVNQIDSLGLLPLRTEEGIPLADDEAAVCVCPYFQTLDNTNIVYSVELYLNGKRFKNRPSTLFNLFEMSGYAGYYFNGPEMLENNIEVPVGIMNKSYLHEGDIVKLRLISITKDYMYFLLNQKLSVGSNPIMGAFPANFSNIFSNCNAIGWFSTTSAVEVEGVYHEW